jgi:hypothetical protein
MGLRETMMELLRTDDVAGLERLVRQDRRALRHLVGRLWDTDERIRRRAAQAIGVAAEAHPELALEVARRLIWALNDESASNGVFGLDALGEMGYRNPQLMAPLVGPMASYAWDGGLRPAIVRAMCRIAERAPELVRPHRQGLGRWADEACTPALQRLDGLLGDRRGGGR